ncbi:ABC transporter ATP-binding protein [Virgibacillus phasianinus]|uniref:ABC transporter ATP-binding protein n=1 Tax=Virgibacillus phasianinus TaxID=2017483 RepID=A0A220U945_9BACI|nr:ABC transporter ATP-binding protein [Virgibacillus phasianinus]
MFSLKKVKVNGIISIDNLIIPDQRITSIVGQSGSGKSTFLRLLNNLDDPDSGEIRFHGDDLQELDPIELRRKVTMVPQTPVIYEGTIKDNLLIGLKFARLEDVSDQHMIDILRLMNLNKSLETIADELSGGEKQRLALGRSMLLSAEVYLLDEPSSSLDDKTASDVIHAYVNYMREHNKTVVMVTHDRELAKEISDNFISMDRYSETLKGVNHNG